MKYIIFLFLTLTFLFAQDIEIVSITTTDGSEIVGTITIETEAEYTVETSSGIKITIPKEAVVKIDDFTGKMKEGKLYRPDPNKSMYLFSPSAFAIGKNNKYCRDFCVLFPSFNYGFSDVLSAQAGIFWIPGLGIDDIPIIGSLKTSIYNKNKLAFAGGAMYMRIPTISIEDEDDIHLGGGFLFVTGTYGDQFNHASLSLGWGFARGNDEWEMMERPIFVLAGNKRISQNIALVGESWIWPEIEFGYVPILLSARFIGKRIATDVGMLFTFETISQGLPFPIINFTYHF